MTDLVGGPAGGVVRVADLERVAHGARQLDALAIERLGEAVEPAHVQAGGDGVDRDQLQVDAADPLRDRARLLRGQAGLVAALVFGLDPVAELPAALRAEETYVRLAFLAADAQQPEARDTAAPHPLGAGRASCPRRGWAAARPSRRCRRAGRDRPGPRCGRCRRPRAAMPMRSSRRRWRRRRGRTSRGRVRARVASPRARARRGRARARERAPRAHRCPRPPRRARRTPPHAAREGRDAVGRRRVVRDQLDHLLTAIREHPHDPVRDRAVHAGAIAARQALVGDLPDERMLEDQLALTPHRRRQPAEDEVAILQAIEERTDLAGVDCGDLRDAVGPEDPTDHRRRLERALLVQRQQIDARGERRVNGVRKAAYARALPGRACARSPRGRTDCPRPARRWRRARRRRGSRRGATRRAALLSAASSGSTARPREPHPAAAPGGMPRRQLGSRGAQHEDRACGMTRDVLEQLEHRDVGPVQILE